jgi:hypothetical protein
VLECEHLGEAVDELSGAATGAKTV